MVPSDSPAEEMTSRTRLLAAARCEPCDRVPVSPFGLGRLDPDSPVARELVRRTDPFLEVGLGVNFFGGANYREERHEEGDLLHVTIPTPRGTLTRVVKRTDVARHTIQFPCSGPAALEKFLAIPWEAPQPDPHRYLSRRHRVGEDGLVLVLCPDAICMPAELMSPQDFCLLWADEPDLMARVVEEAARRVEAVVEAACAAGVRGFRIIGGEYASVQLGPRAFDELVVEHDRRLVDVMHRHGAVAYYHNHGPVMRYLDAFARIGLDFLDPVEMPPYGDADLQRAREIIDGRYCIVGTFDDMEVLEKWPVQKVKAAARERLERYGQRGICLGGSASGTYGERAARAFMAMVEVAEEMA
ncbi:MAG: uroporphyrinogen decarboxylase family protein [Candidatus Brocadiia bacterium]